jgi:hypothetical protein
MNLEIASSSQASGMGEYVFKEGQRSYRKRIPMLFYSNFRYKKALLRSKA